MHTADTNSSAGYADFTIRALGVGRSRPSTRASSTPSTPARKRSRASSLRGRGTCISACSDAVSIRRACRAPQFNLDLYLRLHVLLRREGWQVSHKRVYRLYKLEGLSLRLKTPKKRLGRQRVEVPPSSAPNECRSMDFVSDGLGAGGGSGP